MKKFLVIDDKEVLIEESGGRLKFKLSFSEGQVPLYHKDIICGNMCDFLLPMNFLSNSDILQIAYDFTGCIQFSEALLREKDRGMPVAGKASLAVASVIRSILFAENYLLDADYFPIVSDALFFELKTKNVKLCYIPGMCGAVSVRDRILDLIKATGELSLDEEWIAYGVEIVQISSSQNLGLAEIAFLLEEKAGEMRMKRWPGRSMPENVSKETALVCNEAISKKEKYRFFGGIKK